MSTGRPPNGPRLAVGFMAAGSEMAGFTVLGVVLDLLVFNTLPWLTIVLTVLGFAAAFYHLTLMAKKARGRPPAAPAGRPPAGDGR